MRSKKGVFRPNHVSDEPTKQLSIFKGLLFAVLSGASFSIVSAIVKQIRNLHPGQLALYRFLAIIVMSMPDTVKTGQNPLGPRNLRSLLVLRGVCGGLNDLFNFISFRYLGLGEASVIIFSSPAVVTIFARLFFKEPCNVFHTTSVILTVMGIVFTTKLPSHLTEEPVVYNRERIYGFMAAIFCLFSVSALILITRRIRSIHQSILNFNYGLVAILEISILTAVFGNFEWQQCGTQSLYILLLAFFSYSGLTLMVKALQCEHAGPVSTVRSAVDIGFAFLWQILIFHDTPDFYGIIGVSLVLLSIILIGVGKCLNSL